MIATIIIALPIAAWAVFVVIRKIKRARRGIYCECCDGSCSCGCEKKKEKSLK